MTISKCIATALRASSQHAHKGADDVLRCIQQSLIPKQRESARCFRIKITNPRSLDMGKGGRQFVCVFWRQFRSEVTQCVLEPSVRVALVSMLSNRIENQQHCNSYSPSYLRPTRPLGIKSSIQQPISSLQLSHW